MEYNQEEEENENENNVENNNNCNQENLCEEQYAEQFENKNNNTSTSLVSTGAGQEIA